MRATTDETDKAKTVPAVPEYSVSSASSRSNDGQDDWHIRLPKPRMPQPARLSGRRLKITAVVVLLLATLGMGFLGGWLGSRSNNSTLFQSTSDSQKVVTSESKLISDIAKTVGPSVVSVNVVGTTTDTSQSSLFNYGGGGSQTEESAGTGIIISSSGLILTNRHVVPTGTTSVSVTLSDGTELDNVQVLGRTSESDSLDVAFLKIPDTKGHKLTPAVIGDSSKMQVGDAVVAIGNALGQFQNTVTSGIVSGYGRSVQAGDSSGSSTENLDDLFQTDAAINEGNSGGPLVNLNGQVIGMNTAIASNSQSVGFAIPINDISGLIKQVEATGKFQRPYLGVRYVPLTADVAKQYSLSVTNGAFIVPSTDASTPSIVSGSPAEKAGLQANDVITKADGVSIDQSHSLTSLIDKHSVGDDMKLTVLRDGKTIDITATLSAAPSS
jgi:serine protease Do